MQLMYFQLDSFINDYISTDGEERREIFEKLTKMPIEEVIQILHRDGRNVFFKSPHCEKASRMSDYGGNLVEGSICPKCDQLITNDVMKENLETRFRGGHNACNQS